MICDSVQVIFQLDAWDGARLISVDPQDAGALVLCGELGVHVLLQGAVVQHLETVWM